MPTIYPSLSIPAPKRLAMFRREAQQTNWVRPMTWRDVRFATLTSAPGLGQGLNQGEPVWYSQDGAQFRERDADEVIRIRHTGWFTDVHQDAKAIGIIAKLPHNRFIAGYRWTDNDERVYFPQIYTDEDDAARAADGHAEWFAECAMEDSQRYEAKCDLEGRIEKKEQRLRECMAMRNRHDCLAYARDEARKLIEAIREMRDELQRDYINV